MMATEQSHRGGAKPSRFLVITRAPARALAVVDAKDEAQARLRVVKHLSDELSAPRSVRSLRAIRYTSSTLPVHLPSYAEGYFTDPPWNTHRQ
jgi:hypothetical protein